MLCVVEEVKSFEHKLKQSLQVLRRGRSDEDIGVASGGGGREGGREGGRREET